MPASRTDRALIQQAVNALEATKTEQTPQGNQTEAAKLLGLTRGTLQHRLRMAIIESVEAGKVQDYQLPEFPEDDIPVEEIIASMSKRFQKRNDFQKSLKWFPIKLRTNEPIGLAKVGDPHVDDDGCNWPQLESDIAIMNQPGIYGVNMGDTTNNWVGRLLKKFADQETSQKTAQKLAKWFMCESGITWVAWLLGNHDAWGDGAALLKEMNIKRVPMIDWSAQFKLVFPNGFECRVWASHNFAGHSMWNTLHGSQKAAHMKDWAHIYACGHTHNWALHQEESASREFTYWLARCRGYKYLDEYAERGGHASQQYGATILAVIDPNAKNESSRVQCFADLERGADYLKYLRGKKS